MTSHQKIHQLVKELLDQRANGMVAVSLMALAPQMLKQLPETSEALDQALYEYAAVLLACRSDDARQLALVWADEFGLTPSQVDADAEAVDVPAPTIEAGS